MHCLLDDGVLRIRFCASGAKIQVNTMDKHLNLEIPKGINLSVHTTSALIKADTLNQKTVLIASFSGSTSAGSVDLGAVSAKTLDCSTSSGDVTMGSMISETSAVTTSSGSVKLLLTDVPSAEIHTSSGEVDLTLAKGGAEVLYTSNSGELLTDQTYERKGDLYVFGSGESRLTVATSSGSLEIQ